MSVLLRLGAIATYFINRCAAVFSARELTRDDAPTARSMPAWGNAPGTYRSRCSALKGRRIPAPLQGAPVDSQTKPRALPWAGVRQRVQRRNQGCVSPNHESYWTDRLWTIKKLLSAGLKPRISLPRNSLRRACGVTRKVGTTCGNSAFFICSFCWRSVFSYSVARRFALALVGGPPTHRIPVTSSVETSKALQVPKEKPWENLIWFLRRRRSD
jgi:hypothetical protein